MINIDTPNTQIPDQHRYPKHTNTRPTSIPQTHKYMINIDTPNTQIPDQHRYPKHTNTWSTSIPQTHKYIINIDTPNTQIHDQHPYPKHTNTWSTSIPQTHKYRINIDTPNTQIHDQHRYPKHTNTSPLTYPKHTNTSPLTYPKHTNTSPLTYPKHTNKSPLTYPKHTNTSPLTYPKHTNTSPLTYLKHTNTSPLTYPKHTNTSLLSYPKHTNTSPLTYPKHTNTSSLTYTKHTNTSPLTFLALDNLKSRYFSQVSSIKTFNFSTLYTTLPHDKLKTRLKETIHKVFNHRNYGSKFVVLGYNSTYFSNKFQKGKTCYTEEQVISMLEFLIDNIFVSFGGILFQQIVGIPMGTNCAPLLADLFLYSYESEFLQKLVKDKKIHEARAFNFTYRYIDDVLSINNSRFAEFLPLIHPPELEAKETTDTASSASFLDLYLEFDDSGQISTKIYDKRDSFNFKNINFPNMCSNIPASPAYGVYISQLIRYARASSNYSDFLKRHLHLRNRLLDQGY